MTALDVYPWPYYADLQQRSRKLSRITGYTWGIERALGFLLDAIATGTLPSDPDELVVVLNRIIASEARLNRSHLAALIRFAPRAELAATNLAAAEALIELTRITRLVNSTDNDFLVDTGLGYADREIADRRDSTPGAVRVRLSRLRLRLAA
jgi:DNA-directed RNA polymerase specialized sigma24 family protein